MRHGTRVKIGTDGPIISVDALKTIGIIPSACCWGVWVNDPKGKDSDPDKKVGNSEENKSDSCPPKLRLPQLIISPFHPDSWPFVFELRIKLNHQPGSLERAAEALKNQNLTIIHNECGEDGYSEVTWVLACEDLTLRDAVKNLHREDDGGWQMWVRKNREVVFTALWGRLKKITSNLLEENGKSKFLKQDYVDGKFACFPINGDNGYRAKASEYWDKVTKLNIGEIEKPWGQDVNHTLDTEVEKWKRSGIFYRAMADLYDFCETGENVTNPLQFEFKERDKVLSLQNSKPFAEILSEKHIIHEKNINGKMEKRTTAALALASFETTEYYVRLHFIPEEEAPSVFEVVFNYDIQPSPNIPISSKGLFHLAAKQVASGSRANGLLVHDVTSKRDSTSESGRLKIIAQLCNKVLAGDRALRDNELKKLKDELESQSLRDAWANENKENSFKLNIRAKVSPIPSEFIFISRHLSGIRMDLIGAINRRLLHHGFEGRTPVTLTDSIDDTVFNFVSECKGMIQLYTVSREEIRRKQQYNFSWLYAEYAAAKTLKLPILRLLDDQLSEQEWRGILRLGQGEAAPLINLKESKYELTKSVDRCIDNFITRLTGAADS